MRSHVFKVVGSTVLLREEGFTGVELAWRAARTLGGVRAVEVWDVTVPNVTEPVRLWSVFGPIPANKHLETSARTNELCSRPRRGPERSSGRVHHPISRRRTRLRGRGG